MQSNDIYALDSVLAGSIFNRWQLSQNPTDENQISIVFDKLKTIEMRNANAAKIQLARMYSFLKESDSTNHPRYAEITQYVQVLFSSPENIKQGNKQGKKQGAGPAEQLVKRESDQEEKVDQAVINQLIEQHPTIWPMPPASPGTWTDATEHDSSLIRSVLATIDINDFQFLGCRINQPSFYKDVTFVELLGRWNNDGDDLSLTAIATEHVVGVLNGTSSIIHQYNRNYLSNLILNNQTAFQYLRFFCNNVHSDLGAFHIIESHPGKLLYDKIQDANGDQMVIDLEGNMIEPDEETGSWLVRTIVQYGNNLIRVKFSILKDGMIEMLEDEPIGQAASLFPYKYKGLWRSKY